MYAGWKWVSMCCLASLMACGSESEPATQVVVALNSNMREGSELARVRLEVLAADGTGDPVGSHEFALAQNGIDGTHPLPLTFTVVPSEQDPADRFRLVAYGYRSFDVDAEPFVEQRVIASFIRRKTLLLDMFLGRVCEDEVCDTDSTCYVEPTDGVDAGECGDIRVRTLPEVDPDDVESEVEAVVWPAAATAAPTHEDGDGEPERGGESSRGDEVVADDGMVADDGGLRDSGGEGSGSAGEATAAVGGGACAVEEVPLASCDGPDAFEDNDELAMAARVGTAGSCVAWSATLEGSERDYFSYQATATEAVQVTLQYTAVDGADLEIDMGSAGSADHVRLEPSETEVFTRRAQEVGQVFDFSIRSSDNSGCQPYRVSIDPSFCSDEYEDNDDEMDAASLELGEDGLAIVDANAYQSDDDYYRITLDKRDPFQLTGGYTVEETSSADLRLGRAAVTGGWNSDQGSRTGLTEEWSLWGFPSDPGAIYLFQVDGGSFEAGECVPYHVELNARACTDAQEDDDNEGEATVLEVGTTYEATVHRRDEDFFNVLALQSAGTCTIEYTPLEPGAELITVTSYPTGGSYHNFSDASDGPDGSKVLSVSWTSDTSYLEVSVDGADTVCHPYTLRCE